MGKQGSDVPWGPGNVPQASEPMLGFGQGVSEAKAAVFPGLTPALGPVGIFSLGRGRRVQLMEAKGPHAFCG